MWLSVDPIASYNPFEKENFIDGEHNEGVYNSFNHAIYGYCYQNPIKLVDPNGKQVDPMFNMSPSQWNSYVNSTKVQDIQLKVAQKSAESMLQTADEVAYYSMPMVSYADAADVAWANEDYLEYGVNILAGTLDGLIWVCTLGQSSWVKGGVGGARVATKVGSVGFKSFNAFKRYYGATGQGKAWHHIVEQTTSNISKFGSENIHNMDNVINIDHGAGSLHAKISGYYSSKDFFTGGQTVRQWLSTQSYQAQYDFGIQTLKKFGWTP